jgi:hypothetical protein
MSSGHPVEQAIRRSHCAHADSSDPQHPCVGSCLITPQGVTLTCKLCGDDERSITPAETLPESRLVREVLDAIGIEPGALAPERRARAAEVARRWMVARRP